MLLTPGLAFLLWQWSTLPALINILAALGLETIFLLVLTTVAILVQAARDKSKAATDADDNDEFDPELDVDD